MIRSTSFSPQLYFNRKQKELEQKQKETEARKSKLMKELGGGLKYTAISMANRDADGAAAAGGGGSGGGGSI